MIRFCCGSGCKRQHLRVSYALCFESCLHYLPSHTRTSTDSWRSGPLSGTDKLTCIGVHVDAGLGKPVRPRAFQSNKWFFVHCTCDPVARVLYLFWKSSPVRAIRDAHRAFTRRRNSMCIDVIRSSCGCCSYLAGRHRVIAP